MNAAVFPSPYVQLARIVLFSSSAGSGEISETSTSGLSLTVVIT